RRRLGGTLWALVCSAEPIELRLEFGRQLAREHRHRPARESDLELLGDLDAQLAAVEQDRDRRLAAVENVGHGRSGGAGAARRGLPHSALEDARTNAVARQRREPGDVGAVRKQLMALDLRPDSRQVDPSQLALVSDANRHLRVADLHVLEGSLPAPGAELPAA